MSELTRYDLEPYSDALAAIEQARQEGHDAAIRSICHNPDLDGDSLAAALRREGVEMGRNEREELKAKLAAAEAERDEFKAREMRVRGGIALRQPDNCSDCGRAMVWQREDEGGDVTPGSWMCPNCVMRRCDAFAAECALLRKALYPLVVGCFEADAREDAPEFVNGEPSRGRDALPECAKCCGTGSTDGSFYEDQPIPAHLLCKDCGGWGFLDHDPSATPALDAMLAAELAKASERLKLAEDTIATLEGYAEHRNTCILSRWEAGRPTPTGGYEWKYGGTWYDADSLPKCECELGPTLDAWRDAK